jgi:hypothetical protein
MKSKELAQDADIVDLPDSLNTPAKEQVRVVEEWNGHDLAAAFRAFSGQDEQKYPALPARIPVYEHVNMPGKGCWYVKRSLFEIRHFRILIPALHRRNHVL